MKINYERVSELLSDEAFKETVRGLFILDLEAKAKGSTGPPSSIIYLSLALCSDKPPDPSEHIDDKEFAPYLRANKRYVTEVAQRILEKPVTELVKKGILTMDSIMEIFK